MRQKQKYSCDRKAESERANEEHVNYMKLSEIMSMATTMKST